MSNPTNSHYDLSGGHGAGQRVYGGGITLGLVGELKAQLDTAITNAPAWVGLANEYLTRRKLDEAEICFLAAMYLFDKPPADVQRAFFQVYTKRRLRHDVKETETEQLRVFQASVNLSIPRTIAIVRQSRERLEQELLVCRNALEVEHGGI